MLSISVALTSRRLLLYSIIPLKLGLFTSAGVMKGGGVIHSTPSTNILH